MSINRGLVFSAFPQVEGVSHFRLVFFVAVNLGPQSLSHCMRYERVCIESFGYTLPDEVVTSADLENRLAPLYERLRLPEGRLELMTGIRERRFWPDGMPVGVQSVESADIAIERSGIDRGDFGALIHASVCRDHLEPATACRVHHELGLSPDCLVYDVSNACLGLLNGMVQLANMIELGQISAGVVVGTESSQPVVERTIQTLNDRTDLTRSSIKPLIATLTLGSASCAAVLCDRDLSATCNRFAAVSARAATEHHKLCRSGRDEAGPDMQPLMQTQSESLMMEGIATGAINFEKFLAESGWAREDLDKTFCHQVGSAHHRLMYERLGLTSDRDFTTFPWLGNTGAVALPITMAIGADEGFLDAGDRVGMLGIGSGINCLMTAVEWQTANIPLPSRNGRPVFAQMAT